jgi:hypothetical protein
VRCITSNLIATLAKVDYQGRHAATKPFRFIDFAAARKKMLPLRAADVPFDNRAGQQSGP